MNLSRVQQLIKNINQSDLLTSEDNAYILYDLDLLRSRFRELLKAFPENTLHGIATKACPLPEVIKIQQEFGLGAEAASIEEVMIALKSGIDPSKIIFDGPAKTIDELQFCIDKSIYINIDNFDELKRVKELVKGNKDFKAGFRVNPQVGMGKISDTSVAGVISKFGVNLDGNKDKLKEAFDKYDWLVGLHVHIGSQGMDPSDLVKGTKKVFEFAQTLRGIERFDMGGGLPVVYREDDKKVTFSDYTSLLKKHVPELFDGKIQILTEFGRRIFADTAVAISKIEYVKEDRQIVSHLGADMFLRRVYKPNDWYHQMSALDENIVELKTESQSYTVAGPLCFGGDFLHHDVTLPKVKAGDFLIIHDVGAYTLSMWSRHCSRLTPKVLGVGDSIIKILKNRETIEKLIGFWS